MNKIKIVNEDLLHIMQTTAKDYRVAEQMKKENSMPSRRPKTPQQVLKSMIKEGISPHFHARRNDKMYTVDSHFGSRPESASIVDNNASAVIQKKFADTVISRLRPMTPDIYNQKVKKKSEQLEDISGLKHDIDSVLEFIKQSNQQTKMRMLKKYTDYSHKKFGKYWNPHVNGLTKKGFYNRTRPLVSENPTKIFKTLDNQKGVKKSYF